jgi:hypothetical protein
MKADLVDSSSFFAEADGQFRVPVTLAWGAGAAAPSLTVSTPETWISSG